MIRTIVFGVLLTLSENVAARGAGSHGIHSASHSTSHGAAAHSNSSHSSFAVRGYTKRNGTDVAPHYSSAPDHSKANNWSSRGNVNPYTGKVGTKDPNR